MTIERPNILFFFPDQHRFDYVNHLSDVPIRTPNLDRLAERGVSFENAVCPAPLCGPSRACLASGMEYDRCGVRNHDADFPLAATTYFERLRDEAGYHVIGCGKFDLQKHSGDWGIDGKNNLAANGFSDGINNAGYWDAFGSSVDGWGSNATFSGAKDPYMAYLEEHDLAQAHIDDLIRRRWESGHPGEDVDGTIPTPLPDHAYCDNWIAQNGLDLLDNAPADQPWHLVINFAGPHNPWDVTEDMHGWYRDPDVEFSDPIGANESVTDEKAPDDITRFDSEVYQEVRRNYAAKVENIDRWVGRYLDELERRGELENTVVVYVSDHGEMLGDHGQWNKRSPYRPSAGVPLVAAGPGIEARGVVEEPASVLDLHATFLDVAGLDQHGIDSRSLYPYFRGEHEDHRDVAFSGMGPWRLVVDDRYSLMLGYDLESSANDQVSAFDSWNEADVKYALRDREPILFDREVDPNETENVASSNPEVVNHLREELATMRTVE